MLLSIRTLPGAADSGIWPKTGLEECNFRTASKTEVEETIETGLGTMRPLLSELATVVLLYDVEMDLVVKAAKRGLATS